MQFGFSNSMMSSTVSRLSAARSVVKDAVSVTSFSSTPSLSTTISFTRSAISDIVVIIKWLVNFQNSVQSNEFFLT